MGWDRLIRGLFLGVWDLKAREGENQIKTVRACNVPEGEMEVEVHRAEAEIFTEGARGALATWLCFTALLNLLLRSLSLHNYTCRN